jgi:hypothetical protein
MPSGQPQLPMPQIADTPPQQAPLPNLEASNLPPVGGTPTRPLDYWVAEVQQILEQSGQNPKQKADAIAAIKRHYQQEVLGLHVPNSGGAKV